MKKIMIALGAVTMALSTMVVKAEVVEISDGYAQVEYIESTIGGGQYINTGYIPHKDTKVVCRLYDDGSDTSNNFGALFGSRVGYSQEKCMFLWLRHWGSNAPSYGRAGGESNVVESDFLPYNETVTVTCQGPTCSWVNDAGTKSNKITVTNCNEEQYEGFAPMLIFAINSASEEGGCNPTDHLGFRLYAFKIYEGDTLMRDFVPCVEVETGKAGLWDLVEDKFYENKGDSGFNYILPSIRYYDPVSGKTKYIDAIEVTKDTSIFEDGKWYIVKDTISRGTITVNGSANLILADGAKLTASGAVNYAGIEVEDENSLTIWGQKKESSGCLVANGGEYDGAGIGGSRDGDGGNVTINGGIVTATGGMCGAGIGGDGSGKGGTVTINGGTVTATGGYRSAGIGGGYLAVGGNVTINGGTVTATGDNGGADIGGGDGCDGGEVTINGGNIKAATIKDAPKNAAGETVYCVMVENVGDAAVIEDLLGYGTNDIVPINQKVYLWLPNGEYVFRANGLVYLAIVNGGNTTATKGINYCDAEGNTWTANDVCRIYPQTQSLTIGGGAWYVVVGEVTTAEIIVQGSANLILADGAKLTVDGGIGVNKDNMLTIYAQQGGSGELIANGAFGCAGIGGRNPNYWKGYGNCGNIIINGGVVTATGGVHGAGIGGGWDGAGGTVMINGGTVTAIGGEYGAGIGGGDVGDGGTVTINGGTVTAIGGKYGAGIGGGDIGDGGKVTINGGSVTAYAGNRAQSIGKGDSGDYSGTLTLGPRVFKVDDNYWKEGITVTFDIPEYLLLASIQTDNNVQKILEEDANHREIALLQGHSLTLLFEPTNFKNLIDGDKEVTFGPIVEDTTIDASKLPTIKPNEQVEVDYVLADGTSSSANAYPLFSKNHSVMISAGWYVVKSEIATSKITVQGDVNLILADGATLTVDGGIEVAYTATLNVYGQSAGTGRLIANGADYCAGIGGGYMAVGGNVTINGGTVTAIGGEYAAGIGGGDSGNGGNVTINGGTVTAIGGEYAAGIGGGDSGNGGNVTINGGTVTAIGGEYAAGIGGGDSGNGGNVTINGGTVEAWGDSGGAGIGGGDCGDGGTVTINGGSIKASSIQVQPINDKDASVYCVTVTDVIAPCVIADLGDYGTKDIEPIAGKLYLYLPNNTYVFFVNEAEYVATVDNGAVTATKIPRKVTVEGDLEHLIVEWTFGDGSVVNVAENGYFEVDRGTQNIKVLFVLEKYYRFVDEGETGLRVLTSPLIESCTVTAPAVEVIPGTEVAPWQVGEDVTAYVSDEGVLVVGGEGAMDDFADVNEVPWGSMRVEGVSVGNGVTQIGKNALVMMDDDVLVNGTPISTYRKVTEVETTINGMSIDKYNAAVRYWNVGEEWQTGPASTEPVTPEDMVLVSKTEIEAAKATTIQVVDGTAYLDVSVSTNADLTAEIKNWGKVKLDPATVKQAADGHGLVVPVPAKADKGFMIIRSGDGK